MIPRLQAPHVGRHLIVQAGALDASTSLARLDERLAAAPEPVRAGWIKRALIYEAVASLRLNGAYVSAQDLMLRLHDALDRAPDENLGRAKGIHSMLSTLMRRNPRHLFKAERVRALTRLRLHDRAVDHPDLPDWLQDRIHTPDELVEALEEALQPSAVSAWEIFAAGECGGRDCRQLAQNQGGRSHRRCRRPGARDGLALSCGSYFVLLLLAVGGVSGGGVGVPAGP